MIKLEQVQSPQDRIDASRVPNGNSLKDSKVANPSLFLHSNLVANPIQLRDGFLGNSF